MLLHLVAISLGTAVRNGRTLHGYKAKCGAPIVAAGPLTIGSTITTGPEPHVHCARCFADMNDGNDVKLPEGRLDGAVYDEGGRMLKATKEREDFTAPLQNTVNTRTEDFPYGRPIQRG